jgi:hypothetical protein
VSKISTNSGSAFGCVLMITLSDTKIIMAENWPAPARQAEKFAAT